MYLLLEACLGLEIDAPRRLIQFHRPMLPPFLAEVRIEGLRVGTASVDLTLHRHQNDVGIDLRRREGEVVVSILK